MTCIEHSQMPGKALYGRCKVTVRGFKRQLGLHVRALMAHTEQDPSGRMALHTCDNKRCINPEHLYWGTHTQNMLDRAARCTAHMGLPRKVDADTVRAIQASALDYDGMAAAFGLSRTACFNIRNGRTYKDIT